MTNTVTNILSHDEELALRKPIEDYVGTVSYTHLTLPTNREV